MKPRVAASSQLLLYFELKYETCIEIYQAQSNYNMLELLRRIDQFYCSSNPPALKFKTKTVEVTTCTAEHMQQWEKGK